jgi:NADH-quinone oxidoreductase subunit H
MAFELIETGAKIAFVFAVVMGFFAPVLGWVERKQSAVLQDRIGANRADIFGFTLFGLFHPLSDAIKLIVKEDFVPKGAHVVLHTLAPLLALIPALLVFSVIPFAGKYEIFGNEVNFVIADLDVGILFIFAVASLATYGVVIAGWASNNNWSLLGGLRASAQMISYEVTMGLTIMGLIMIYGSLRLTEIGMAQENFFRWGIFLQPVGFFLFMACAIAENKRAPFDVPEAESELVAGYFLEYSGMRFIMFWMSEFIEVTSISAIATLLFFGGWHIPFVGHQDLVAFFSFTGPNAAQILTMLTHIGVFLFKMCAVIWLQMMIRWTLPRFRYDQIMALGWKFLLPLSLANIGVTGVIVLLV